MENWTDIPITVTIKGQDGFKDNVSLSAETDDELLNAVLTDEVVHVGSTEKTSLTLSPERELQGSTHSVTVTATDSYGRTKSSTYEIEFRTKDKPQTENRVIEEWTSDEKPDEEGRSETSSCNLLGVTGKLRDANTGGLLLHDHDQACVNVDVDETGYNGPAGWPINSQYDHSLGRTSPETWHMDLRADAYGYNWKKGSVTDSYSKPGPVHKNFSLQPTRPH